MITTRRIGLGVFLAAGLGGQALAADLPASAPKVLPEVAATASTPIDFIFGARIQSDYNFRGISQSNRNPSLQAYGELQLFDNFLYFGVAGYQVDLPTRPAAEIDLTAGIRPKFGALTLDFGVIGYVYPDETRFNDLLGGYYLANTDFVEFAGKASYTFSDQFSIGGNVFHAYDWLGTGADATYVSATAKYTFPDLGIPGSFAISGELGHYMIGRTSPQLLSIQLPDYTYWNAGVSYTYKNLTVDLRYHDTDLSKTECFTLTGDPRGFATGSGRSKWCSEAVIATLAVDFTASQLPGIFAPAR